MLPESEERAYLAGFFDGEGCIGIYATAGPRAMALVIQVTGTHEGSIRRLYERYGGTFGKRTGKKYSFWESRPAWYWKLRGRSALSALEEWLPYLVVKKHEALEAMKFPFSVNRVLEPWMVETRELLGLRLRAMKVPNQPVAEAA